LTNQLLILYNNLLGIFTASNIVIQCVVMQIEEENVYWYS